MPHLSFSVTSLSFVTCCFLTQNTDTDWSGSLASHFSKDTETVIIFYDILSVQPCFTLWSVLGHFPLRLSDLSHCVSCYFPEQSEHHGRICLSTRPAVPFSIVSYGNPPYFLPERQHRGVGEITGPGVRMPGFKSWLLLLPGCVTLDKLSLCLSFLTWKGKVRKHHHHRIADSGLNPDKSS